MPIAMIHAQDSLPHLQVTVHDPSFARSLNRRLNPLTMPCLNGGISVGCRKKVCSRPLARAP